MQLAVYGAVSLRVPVQVPPASLNETEPVGVAAPGETGATTPASVTACPTTAGLGLALTVVVVASCPMTTDVDEPEFAKLVSPE